MEARLTRFHMGTQTTRSWTRGHACYGPAKNLSTSCLYSEAGWKNDKLINVAEKILKQPGIHDVA